MVCTPKQKQTPLRKQWPECVSSLMTNAEASDSVSIGDQYKRHASIYVFIERIAQMATMKENKVIPIMLLSHSSQAR